MAVVLDRGVDNPLRLGSLGDVPSHSDSFAAGSLDGVDHRGRTSFAGCVIHHHGRAFRGQRLSDSGSNTFGGARNHCYLTFEFAHMTALNFPLRRGS